MTSNIGGINRIIQSLINLIIFSFVSASIYILQIKLYGGIYEKPFSYI